MIKILKPGTKKEITCDKCGALLSYDEKEDVKEEYIEKKVCYKYAIWIWM